MKRIVWLVTGVAVIALSGCSDGRRATGAVGVETVPSTTLDAPIVVSPTMPTTPATQAPPNKQSTTPATDAVAETTTRPTSTPVVLPPTTAPQLVGDDAAMILAYLRSNFAGAPWLGSIRQISVQARLASVSTELAGDGRGETFASQICGAVLGNDRVPLSAVTVGAAGGTTAAGCQR